MYMYMRESEVEQTLYELCAICLSGWRLQGNNASPLLLHVLLQLKGCLKRPVHTCIQLESEDPRSCATLLAWSKDVVLASDASTESSAVRISFSASKTLPR